MWPGPTPSLSFNKHIYLFRIPCIPEARGQAAHESNTSRSINTSRKRMPSFTEQAYLVGLAFILFEVPLIVTNSLLAANLNKILQQHIS